METPLESANLLTLPHAKLPSSTCKDLSNKVVKECAYYLVTMSVWNHGFITPLQLLLLLRTCYSGIWNT